LYFVLMSAPVWRIVRMTLSSRDAVGAVAAQGEAGGVDRFHGAHGIALDAGDLHETADGIAGEPEIVLHADLSAAFFHLRHGPRRALRTRPPAAMEQATADLALAGRPFPRRRWRHLSL